MAVLDGPRLPPRAGGRADSLVVLLHGYGADGRDLIDLGKAWGKVLPRTAFVSPHGPDPCAQAPVGRQWFPLTSLDPHDLARGVAGAAPILRRFLQEELDAHGLDATRLALVGFSQGTMMALDVATSDVLRPAAVVGYSGAWVGAGGGGSVQVAEPPPILLVHGTADEVIPAGALFGSAYGLAAAGVPVEWHLCHGLGHGIDPEGLGIGGDFLARALAEPGVPRALAAMTVASQE